MKKTTLAISALSMVGVLALAGCNCSNKNNKNNSIKVDANDVYALSALSSVNYLSNLDSTVAVGLTTIEDNHKAMITDCLTMFDDILETGGFSQKVEKNTSTDEKLSGYTFTMNISIPGYDNILTMYYDELDTKTKVEIEDQQEEKEVSTTLEGIVSIDGVDYPIKGKKELEQEGEEKEASIEFTTYSPTNNLNYITVEQSIENNEIEYEYSFFENGVLITQTEIEIENEDDKLVLELELENSKNELVKCKITKKDDKSFNLVYFNKGNELTATAIKLDDDSYVIEYNN